MSNIFVNLFHSLESYLFPQFCLECTTPLETSEVALCGKCLKKIEPTDLGNWIQDVTTAENLDYAYSLFWFGSILQSCIHLIKYQNITGVIQSIVTLGIPIISELNNIQTADLVVPVPLHHVKYRERGFNQAELITTELYRKLGLRTNNRLLKRKSWTETQTHLSVEKRRANTSRAFQVRGNITGMNILLVDDVLTTGATADSCAAALKKSGASKVGILSLGTPRQTNKVSEFTSV